MKCNHILLFCCGLMLASCGGGTTEIADQPVLNDDTAIAPAPVAEQIDPNEVDETDEVVGADEPVEADAINEVIASPEVIESSDELPQNSDSESIANLQGSLGFGSSPDGLLPFVQTEVVPDSEAYQNLRAEVQAVLSPECLLAGTGPVTCYVPSTRTLTTVRFDGTQFWSFPLPGNNATNRIEGLEHISFDELAIVANVTREPGRPMVEMSIFKIGSGAFVGTYPLFDNLLELNGQPGSSRLAVNIQGEPTLSLGVFGNFQQEADSTRLVVAGNYYRLISGGDASQLNDWRHSGVVINTISTQSQLPADTAPPRLAAQFIPGAVISDTAVEYLDREGNTVELMLNDQNFSVEMLRLANLPPSFSSDQPLSANLMHQRIPDTLQEVRSNSNYTSSAATFNRVGEPSLLPGVPHCEPESNLPANQTLQCTRVTDIIETQCFTGAFTDQIMSERHFSPEIGAWTIWTRTLDFNQCVNDSSIPVDFFRTLRNGIVEIKRYDGDIFGGSLHEEVTTFVSTSFAITQSGPNTATRFETTLNGSIREAESISDTEGVIEENSIAIDQYQVRSRTVGIRGGLPPESEIDNLPVDDVITVTNHNFSSTENVSTDDSDITLIGSYSVAYGTAVSLDVDVSLMQSPDAADSANTASNISGFLTVSQSDGTQIRVTANEQTIEQFSGATLEAVFQSAAGETQSYTFPTEGLINPWGSASALQ